ncbi:Gag-Pro-Pol polyprotein [Dictyocoela roeselum]|nr:Gag-Pro-Pol polyprotein [Dictyocoela roeselum]
MPKLYEKILIDIKGPIKYSHFKNNKDNKTFHILAITEFISRYTEIIIINDINTRTVCTAVKKNWLLAYNTPKYCFTDNGRQFTSLNFSELLSQYNIKHINTSPYNPSGNSVIERIN